MPHPQFIGFKKKWKSNAPAYNCLSCGLPKMELTQVVIHRDFWRVEKPAILRIACKSCGHFEILEV